MKCYVAKNGQTTGPFTVEEIRAKLASGEVHIDDACIPDDGSTDWQPISTRLADQLPKLPPPPPPPAGVRSLPTISPEVREKLSFGLKEFLFLRRMLTPAFLQVVYVIGVGLIVLAYLCGSCATLFGASHNPYADYPGFSSGPPTFLVLVILLVSFIVSLVVWRVSCEVLIVIFRIHDFLREIRDTETSRNAPTS